MELSNSTVFVVIGAASDITTSESSTSVPTIAASTTTSEDSTVTATTEASTLDNQALINPSK